MFSKKIFLPLFLFIASISASFSQEFFTLGIGGNRINARSFKKITYFPNYGINLSAGYEKIFSDPLGFRLELSFNTRKISSLFAEKNVSRDYKFYDDIEQVTLGVPILTTLHFKRLSFEVGAYFDFLLHSRQVEREIIIYSYGNQEENIYRDRQEFTIPEIGFIAGLKVPITRHFILSARYVQGFTALGPEYLWVRPNMLQLSGVIKFGSQYTPSRVKSLPKSTGESTVQNYRTVTFQNIARVDYNRVSPGNRIYFRIRSSDFSTNFISDFTIQGSSGSTVITNTEKSINDAIFPYQGTIRYTVTNNLTRSSYDCYMEFQINEAGTWEIVLVNH